MGLSADNIPALTMINHTDMAINSDYNEDQIIWRWLFYKARGIPNKCRLFCTVFFSFILLFGGRGWIKNYLKKQNNKMYHLYIMINSWFHNGMLDIIFEEIRKRNSVFFHSKAEGSLSFALSFEQMTSVMQRTAWQVISCNSALINNNTIT